MERTGSAGIGGSSTSSVRCGSDGIDLVHDVGFVVDSQTITGLERANEEDLPLSVRMRIISDSACAAPAL
jgi:hypothetical protein